MLFAASKRACEYTVQYNKRDASIWYPAWRHGSARARACEDQKWVKRHEKRICFYYSIYFNKGLNEIREVRKARREIMPCSNVAYLHCSIFLQKIFS